MFVAILVAFLFGGVTVGQTTGLGPYGCVVDSGISQLPACDRLGSTITACFAGQQTTTQNPAIQSCWCKQNCLNDIIDCESEQRLCYENNMADANVTLILEYWSNWCYGFTSTTFTKPILSTLTVTSPTAIGSQADYCTQVGLSSCGAWTQAEASCLLLDKSATASTFLSCACQTSLLSLASVCAVDVEATCYGKSMNVNSVALFSICGSTYSNGQLIYTNSLGNRTTVVAVTSASRTVITSVVSSASSTSVPSSSASAASTSSHASATSSASSASATASKSAQTSSSLGTVGKVSLFQGSDHGWMSLAGLTVSSLIIAIVML